MTTVFAWVYMIVSAIVIVFQLALMLGAPLGEFTLGGRYPGRLPAKLRVAVLTQIAVIVVFAAIVGIRAGLFLGDYSQVGSVGVWFVVAFFVLGSILNLSSPSIKEKAVMGPMNVLALLSAVIVALS